MATTTVPDVLINLQAQLAARPALIGPPKVAVHLIDLDTYTDPEAIVFGRVFVAGATTFAWGSVEGSRATLEPPSLSGYVYVTLPGDSDSKAADALRRGGTLLEEVMQQLRDDPSLQGALAGRARRAPLVESAAWTTGLAQLDQVAVVRLYIDWTISWNAVTF